MKRKLLLNPNQRASNLPDRGEVMTDGAIERASERASGQMGIESFVSITVGLLQESRLNKYQASRYI